LAGTLSGVHALPLALALVAFPAAAQAEPPESAPAPEAPPARISSPRPPGLADAPAASVTIIDVATARLPGDSVADIVARAPGATVRELGGPGSARALSLRGSSADEVVVLLDGIRLAPPAGGGFDLSLVSPDVLERIEVVRGAEGALFGAGAVGGVVRLWTPRPAPGAPARASGFASYGDFVTFAAGGAASAGVGPAGLLVAGGLFHTDGAYPYRDERGELRRRANSAADRGELLLRLAAPLGARFAVDALADVAADARGVEGPAQCPSPTAHERDARALLALTLAADGLATPLDRAAVTLSARGESFAFEDPDPCFGPRAPFASRSGAGGAALRYELPFGPGGRHVARAVLEGNVEHLASRALAAPVTRPELGALAALELSMAGGRLVVAPALRVAAAGGLPAALAPRLGVVFGDGPGSAWTVRAGGGRSWRYPSFHELYVALDGVAGNPALAPEDAWEADAGASYGARGPGWRLTLDLSLFATRVANVILFAPVSGALVEAQSYEGVLVLGGEASARLELPGGIAVSLDAQVARARFLSDPTLALPGRPDAAGAARLSWTSPWRRVPLRLWLGADARGPVWLDRLNHLREEGRVLVSAGASYEVARGVTVRLEGKNLGDERDAVDALQLPLPGRAFYGELRWAL
jgi:iron complex outermembrane receptor protein